MDKCAANCNEILDSVCDYDCEFSLPLCYKMNTLKIFHKVSKVPVLNVSTEGTFVDSGA